MARQAIAIADAEEARECIDYVVDDLAPVSHLAVLSVATVKWFARMAVHSGMVYPSEAEDEALYRATQVGVAALDMLPPTVCGSYIVCRGWCDPAIKSQVLAGGYEQLVVANRGFGTRRIRVQAALHGAGVVVRSINHPRSVETGPIVATGSTPLRRG